MKKIPNVFVIVFSLIVLAAIATWLLPGGQYERKEIRLGDTNRTVLVEGTYKQVDSTPQMPKLLAADVQYGVQLLVNFFIPSGSTKAALTMPIMAPLADLSGITRQTARCWPTSSATALPT